MNISLLCNTGLCLKHDGHTLLIDLPNCVLPPYYTLPDETWRQILQQEAPYGNVSGIYFTHDHPDHCDRAKIEAYQMLHPETPVDFPSEEYPNGVLNWGPFEIEFASVPHTPIPFPEPPHRVTLIRAGEMSVYVAGDAALQPELHRNFLQGRVASVGIWNSMFLSRPETRSLIQETAHQVVIYHMPLPGSEDRGIWRKCQRNLERYPEELKNTKVIDHYPAVIL